MSQTKNHKSWGGARDGAGRPRSSVVGSHVARPNIEGEYFPKKITIRVRSAFDSLRSESFFEVFERATLRARRNGLRILHFGIYDKRIELICEFRSNEQLEKSFKSLNTSLAIFLKKQFKNKNGDAHKGPVMLGRYQLEQISSREKFRQAIEDTLWPLDWHRKHENIYSSSSLVQRWEQICGFAKPEYVEAFSALSKDEYIERMKKITALPQFRLSKQFLASGVQ